MDQWLRMLHEFEYRRQRLLQEAHEERLRLAAGSEPVVLAAQAGPEVLEEAA